MHLSALFTALLTVLMSAPLAQAAEANPARGDPAAIALGATLYQANCARCHGEQATLPSAEAPDLRRLNSFCQALKDPPLEADRRRRHRGPPRGDQPVRQVLPAARRFRCRRRRAAVRRASFLLRGAVDQLLSLVRSP